MRTFFSLVSCKHAAFLLTMVYWHCFSALNSVTRKSLGPANVFSLPHDFKKRYFKIMHAFCLKHKFWCSMFHVFAHTQKKARSVHLIAWIVQSDYKIDTVGSFVCVCEWQTNSNNTKALAQQSSSSHTAHSKLPNPPPPLPPPPPPPTPTFFMRGWSLLKSQKERIDGLHIQ